MGTGEGLMPARKVVVAGDAVETELLVDGGEREFGGVDGTPLEGLEDFAARQQCDRRTEALNHLSAQSREADLETDEIIRCLDGLSEPAGGFWTDQAT